MDEPSVPSTPMSSTLSSPRGIGPPSKRLGSYESPRSHDPVDNVDMELLSVSWKQDFGCFAAGTSRGFRIYNCGGFKIVEMLFCCNILALVVGAVNSQYPPNKVLIWDDHQSRCIGEFTFRSDIRGVKLRRDQIVVVLEHKTYVYTFMDWKLLHQIETLSNPRGLCCLSHHTNTSVLACPGLRRGYVRIEYFGLNMTKFINAHDSQVACLTLTMDGLLLATTSAKGTLIRIFNTVDGTRLQEVRRGLDRAEIYSIALSPNVRWLAVSSDKGTVHIFGFRVRVDSEHTSAHSSVPPKLSLHNQNSSTALETLLPSSTGADPGSLLSFMRDSVHCSFWISKYCSNCWHGGKLLLMQF